MKNTMWFSLILSCQATIACSQQLLNLIYNVPCIHCSQFIIHEFGKKTNQNALIQQLIMLLIRHVKDK